MSRKQKGKRGKKTAKHSNPVIKSVRVSHNKPSGRSDDAVRTTTAHPQLMEQQRAAYALRCVEAAVSDEYCKNSEFKAYARRLPAMIQTNGLGQAAAFYRSKGQANIAYQRHYQLLSDWLTREQRPYASLQDLLEGITSQDMHSYRVAQAEAQALLSWVKKFAEALCIDKIKEPAP